MAVSNKITPNLSLDEVLEICSKNGNVFGGTAITVSELKSEPVINLISAGKGFCSYVYQIKLSTDKNDYSFVAKIPSTRNYEPSPDLPPDEQVQQKEIRIKMISELHSNEIKFYELCRTHHFGSLKIPKYYFGREMSENQEGLILMEDLSQKCQTSLFKGLQFLNVQQIKESIVEIAKLQAWGFTVSEAETTLGKLDTFKSVLNFYFNQSLEKLNEQGYPWFTVERLEKLKKAATFEEFNNGCMGNFMLPLVLSHDDFWAGNLLFADDGTLLTILDWQISRFTSPTQDFAALLALGLPSEQRRKCEMKYLQFYYDTLKHYLDEFNVQDDKGYRNLNFEDLKKVYRISLKISIFRVIITWQNYDTLNPALNGNCEPPLQNLIRCLLEDLEDFL
uniref:CHK kinase-like domain-containing protein n=1 Tax=Panagrolaimus sp. ES5 TaxID=591445 RepID=A0AC34FA73_9BILA